jgi:hypothetical protein
MRPDAATVIEELYHLGHRVPGSSVRLNTEDAEQAEDTAVDAVLSRPESVFLRVLSALGDFAGGMPGKGVRSAKLTSTGGSARRKKLTSPPG